jgi:protocatechuate 3,4-dioxygenase beta subunit
MNGARTTSHPPCDTPADPASADSLLASSILGRRRLLGLGALGALSALGLAACGSDDGSSASPARSAGSGSTSTTTPATGTTVAGSATAAECTTIPEETAGPYPGDGSNGPDVLTQDGVARADIRSNFGNAAGTAGGVPARLQFTVVDAGAGCTPMKDAAVYVWHCDGAGRYSMYSSGATDANFLRGVQPTAADGSVTFESLFPGTYAGRWPHVHFEVYPNVNAARSATGKIATSQLALPRDLCNSVYAANASQYPGSAANLAQLSLDTDMVFGDDGAVHEMATVTGNSTDGYTLALRIPVLVEE